MHAAMPALIICAHKPRAAARRQHCWRLVGSVAMAGGKEVRKRQRIKADIWLMEPSFAPNSSATERDEWLEAISRSIEEYAKKRITFCPSRSLDEVLSFPYSFFSVFQFLP